MLHLKSSFLAAVLLVILTGNSAWAEPTTPKAVAAPPAIEQVLDSRCGVCHTRGRIDAARARGEDMAGITSRMEGLGATLSAEERTAILTFWGPALKPAPKAAPPKAAMTEAEAVIEFRCLQCHTRERIDQAIAAQLPFATMEAIMLKRGVALSKEESGVLKIFWGSPLAK